MGVCVLTTDFTERRTLLTNQNILKKLVSEKKEKIKTKDEEVEKKKKNYETI